MRDLLLKPIISVSIVLGLFIIGELLIIGGLTWRNHQRLITLEKDIKNGHRLEQAIFFLLDKQQKIKNQDLTNDSSKALQNIFPADRIDSPEIIADFKRLQSSFTKALEGDNDSLLQTVKTTRKLFARQTKEEESLLGKIAVDSQLELELSIALPLLAFMFFFIVGRFFFKRNILMPLESLKLLLQMLAQGDRSPIQYDTNDPLMHDLFVNYNQLVMRLTELEQEHHDYTKALEHEVRQVTSTLLEQSQQIARSERLSVVAELAASTAHELRNPLAGIQLALENILLDCQDLELSERLTAVNAEVKRITQHLNNLLALARTPSSLSETIDIAQVCEELNQFVKYQIPGNIKLDYDIETGLVTKLPLTEFRLALMNLLLNAIQAIGTEVGNIQLTGKRQDEQIILNVEDSGPGFAESLLNTGIQPFVSLKEKGTGLGLTAVQRFIKSQQGTIRLGNTSSGHACVTLTLPIQK